MKTLETIVNAFPISSAEYDELDRRFGKLAHYAAWQLKKRNSHCAGTNELDDDVQELRIALIRAASYYKRQTYIEGALAVLEQHVQDRLLTMVVEELKRLWEDRRRHGANRQKFGEYHESILDCLMRNHVPPDTRPRKDQPLQLDAKFVTYCKQILWNAQKALGKQITRERAIRHHMVSLSEFDFLAHEN